MPLPHSQCSETPSAFNYWVVQFFATDYASCWFPDPPFHPVRLHLYWLQYAIFITFLLFSHVGLNWKLDRFPFKKNYVFTIQILFFSSFFFLCLSVSWVLEGHWWPPQTLSFPHSVYSLVGEIDKQETYKWEECYERVNTFKALWKEQHQSWDDVHSRH